jgi:hypothetical protein
MKCSLKTLVITTIFTIFSTFAAAEPEEPAARDGGTSLIMTKLEPPLSQYLSPFLTLQDLKTLALINKGFKEITKFAFTKLNELQPGIERLLLDELTEVDRGNFAYFGHDLSQPSSFIQTVMVLLDSRFTLSMSSKRAKVIRRIKAHGRFSEERRELLTKLLQGVSKKHQCAGRLIELRETEAAARIYSAIGNDPAIVFDYRLRAADGLYALRKTKAAVRIYSAIGNDPAIAVNYRLRVADRLRGLGKTEAAVRIYITIAGATPHNSVEQVLKMAHQSADQLKRLKKFTLKELRTIRDVIDENTAVSSNDKFCVALFVADKLRASSTFRDQDEAVQIYRDIGNNTAADGGCRLRAVDRLMQLARTEAAMEVYIAIGNDTAVSCKTRLEAADRLIQLGRKKAAVQVYIAIGNDTAVSCKTRLEVADRLIQLGRKKAAVQVYIAIGNDTATREQQDRASRMWGSLALRRALDERTARSRRPKNRSCFFWAR